MSFAGNERAALVETMRAVGPHAPTLCGEWTTTDLAAHLIVREGRPDAAAGIMVPAFEQRTARIQADVARWPWDKMLRTLAAGPPLYSPFKWADRFVNATEMFVHHEDVRRAAPKWTVRELSADGDAALRRALKLMARPLLGKVPTPVRLVDSTGALVVAGGSGDGPAVQVKGEIGELLMFAFGRAQAVFEFSGDAKRVAAVQASSRGI